jgi:hypothetical protein
MPVATRATSTRAQRHMADFRRETRGLAGRDLRTGLAGQRHARWCYENEGFADEGLQRYGRASMLSRGRERMLAGQRNDDQFEKERLEIEVGIGHECPHESHVELVGSQGLDQVIRRCFRESDRHEGKCLAKLANDVSKHRMKHRRRRVAGSNVSLLPAGGPGVSLRPRSK